MTELKAGPPTDQAVALSTQRLQLSPLAVDHVTPLHEMSVEREVRRYLWAGEIIPVAKVEEMVAASQACFTAHGTGLYAMLLNDDTDPDHGAFVGFCGHRVDAQDGMELLFGMLPKFWGRGFGQEAARRVLAHGFDSCGLERVLATTDTPNQRSVHVLQRLGMSFSRRAQRNGLDTVFFQMTAAEHETL